MTEAAGSPPTTTAGSGADAAKRNLQRSPRRTKYVSNQLGMSLFWAIHGLDHNLGDQVYS